MSLKAGDKLCVMRIVLLGVLSCFALSAQVAFVQEDGDMKVQINGKDFTRLYYGPQGNKPYLHPLRSASGKMVTRRYPMDPQVPGESIDHPHHRGLWFSHGAVNGIDYWANEPSQMKGKQGRIVLDRVIEAKGGRKSGELHVAFRWITPQIKQVLAEDRRMIFYADSINRIIDFDIRLTAIEDAVFGDTKEGLFAMRLAAGLEEPYPKAPEEPKRTGMMMSPVGCHTEKECWGKRANWMDYAGEVDGEKLGVAIFDHPENLQHPTFWHVRGGGLFAANPFGLHDFQNEPGAVKGEFKLAKGQELRLRYRVVVHPGDAAGAGLAAMYAAWAK